MLWLCCLCPRTIDTQQTGCRRVFAFFLNLKPFSSSVSASLLYPLSPLMPCFYPKSTCQSAVVSYNNLRGLFQGKGLQHGVLYHRAVCSSKPLGGSRALFFSLIPHASGLISCVGGDTGREGGQACCMCGQVVLKWCFVV